MSTLSSALAGLALAATLSGLSAGPASAAPATPMHRHHRFAGEGARPGEGRSHYDREAHDDPTLF
ncbi:MAG TPA: hypothetical protein VHL53_20170 [Acidimicrobiia bacterium]|nr:hypothetical protein [Acidimicrobiia bacterium]